MTSVAVILLVTCIYCLSYTEAEDTMQMIDRVMRTCRERHKIHASDIETAVKNKKLPQGEKGRGFLMCIIKEVGFNQLKKIIRNGGRLRGDMAGLIELPDFEKELDETSVLMAVT